MSLSGFSWKSSIGVILSTDMAMRNLRRFSIRFTAGLSGLSHGWNHSHAGAVLQFVGSLMVLLLGLDWGT